MHKMFLEGMLLWYSTHISRIFLNSYQDVSIEKFSALVKSNLSSILHDPIIFFNYVNMQ